MNDLAAKFAEFHANNPRVYELFKRFTFEALRHNHRHLSADMILHRVRWETGVMTHDPEGWKINNNWCAFYSRMFMDEYPQHAGFFRTRASAADISARPDLEGPMNNADLDADHECKETYRECIENKRQQTRKAISDNPNASSRELAKDLPVSKSTVARTRKSESVPPGTLPNQTQRSRATDLLNKDPTVSNVAIAAMAGCSEKTVRLARRSFANSNVVKLPVKAPTPGEVEYPTAVKEWINAYKMWPKSTQKLAREAFFATINGVEVNVR